MLFLLKTRKVVTGRGHIYEVYHKKICDYTELQQCNRVVYVPFLYVHETLDKCELLLVLCIVKQETNRLKPLHCG